MPQNPNIRIFDGKIGAKTLKQSDLEAFERWMKNPTKFPEDQRAAAEDLVKKAKEFLSSAPAAPKPMPTAGARPQQRGGNVRNDNAGAASPEVYEGAFHNPYTFIPFPKAVGGRHEPTPLTIDEVEKDRFTGVMEVTVKTLSPLLSPNQQKRLPTQEPVEPEKVEALCVSEDVIVPATAIRGCLRSLTAIISGSALDYVDDGLFLCQQRDCQLDREHLYLAIVDEPGDETHSGKVKFGPAVLVRTSALPYNIVNDNRERDKYSGATRKARELWIDNPNAVRASVAFKQDATHTWRVKVSGRKVNQDGIPHEGAVKINDLRDLVLPPELWRDFIGRHRNAQKQSLKNGDMVWLEPSRECNGSINQAEDVQSLQWARWGRHGVNFLDLLKQRYPHMVPDMLKDDGLVDITSDLFGAIPGDKKSFPAFAGRIRPDNLVFRDAKEELFWNKMPVLTSPHPGCMAFYADNKDYDAISLADGPRGYKVYRTWRSQERDVDAPWLYSTQPVYDRGVEKDFEKCAAMTKERQLLPCETSGSFRLSLRSLNKSELALLLLVLSCDLRIGGGKPLGLGHCKVTGIVMKDEFGKVVQEYTPNGLQLPEDFRAELDAHDAWRKNAEIYCKTQNPVEKMLYPRAGKPNKISAQFGGMCWFSEFASPQKGNNANGLTKGLQTKKVAENSKMAQKTGGVGQIKAQGLPYFNDSEPEADRLYGYGKQLKYQGSSYVSDCQDYAPPAPEQQPNYQNNQGRGNGWHNGNGGNRNGNGWRNGNGGNRNGNGWHNGNGGNRYR